MKRPHSHKTHTPVMVREVMGLLQLEENPGGVYLDATVSTGGHAGNIARLMNEEGLLLGLDLDKEALMVAKDRLEPCPPRTLLYHLNYSRIGELRAEEKIPEIDGVLFDLGMSSFQLDKPERGFSFQTEGPLDMRMDPSAELTAADLVKSSSREELTTILRKYGEENWASVIAKAIIDRREEEPIRTTKQLRELVTNAIPEKHRHKRKSHPATRTFQALRIAVNDELTNLEQGLSEAFENLREGGRLVVISYHSLEDRMVKRFFRHKGKSCICPPQLPVCRCDKKKEAEELIDGPLRPSEREVENNPRARSALLRAARKL